MKKRLLIVIAATGLMLGLGGRAAYQKVTFDRVEHVFGLFEKICLAGTPADPMDLGLVVTTHHLRGETWVDARSKTFVNRHGRRCATESIGANNFSLDEARQFAVLAEAAVERGFPDLVFDEDVQQDGSAYLRAWFQGPRHSEDRWGIFVLAASPGSEGGATVLQYYAKSKAGTLADK